MREYDDYDDQSIRLYTPILQRVIILAAVIIAVPVVMWTITTFVRSYVARPRVPALEHLVSSNTLSRIPMITPAQPSATPSAADKTASLEAAAPSDATKAATESNKGPANLASLPEASPSSGAANGPSAASLQASPAIAAPAATATSDATTVNSATAPVASLPRSVQGASQAPSQVASQAPPQMPRPTDNTALSSGSSDRGIAWPNPNTTSPPDFGGPRLSPAASPLPAARSAAAEVVAPYEPLRGPVPLPRHRPIFAMSTSSPATSGPVPLPRARPADAPAEAANPVIEPAYPPDTNRF